MQHSTSWGLGGGGLGGGRGYIPTTLDAHGTPSALGSLLLRSDWESFVAGRHFQKSSLHMRFIFAAGRLQPPCRLMLRLNPPTKNKDGRGGRTIFGRHFLILCGFFMEKVRYLFIFGFFLGQIFKTVFKNVSLRGTKRFYLKNTLMP